MAAYAVVDAERQPAQGGSDRIRLTGIAAYGHHGVYDSERRQGQRFVVDVSCSLDLSSAATTDDLGKTIDYGALAQAVAADVERDPLNLIEALADRIALTCLRYEAVQCVEVTVHKPQAPMPVDVADVAVTLTRSRRYE
jgi:7,8-dihydroneopterin aldolase/epimerase/oxygenase